MNNRLVALAVVALSALALGSSALRRGATAWSEEDLTQFVFFAVLEGLYEDGVQVRVAERILGADAKPEEDPGHFIPGCPICQPVRDAFLVYAKGPRILTWMKGRPSPLGPDDPIGFGDGLTDTEVARLTGDDRPTRLKGLEELVDRYVRRAIERRRLNDDERASLDRSLEEGRKQGMTLLQGGANAFGDRCPSCDGANGGG